MKSPLKLIISAFVFILFFIIAFVSCNERIDAGYEGILVKLYGTDKGVQDVSLVTGRVWYNQSVNRECL